MMLCFTGVHLQVSTVGREKALPFQAFYGLACNASLMQAYFLLQRINESINYTIDDLTLLDLVENRLESQPHTARAAQT